MILGAITGVPTPACLSAASNPVEAVTPPCGAGTNIALGTQRTVLSIARGRGRAGDCGFGRVRLPDGGQPVGSLGVRLGFERIWSGSVGIPPPYLDPKIF